MYNISYLLLFRPEVNWMAKINSQSYVTMKKHVAFLPEWGVDIAKTLVIKFVC